MRPKSTGVTIKTVRCQWHLAPAVSLQVCMLTILIFIFIYLHKYSSGRGHRTRDTARMAKIIAAEDSDDGGSKPTRSRKRRSKPKKTNVDEVSDPGDANFSASSRGEGESSVESENDSDVMEITNEEVSSLL
jgi:hypothetical protein